MEKVKTHFVRITGNGGQQRFLIEEPVAPPTHRYLSPCDQPTTRLSVAINIGSHIVVPWTLRLRGATTDLESSNTLSDKHDNSNPLSTTAVAAGTLRRKAPFRIGSLADALVVLAMLFTATHRLSVAGAKLDPFAQISSYDVTECSGIIKSRQAANLYWVHNDSAGGTRVFGIRRDGTLVATIETEFSNTDWEDIATDDSGNLYLGDFGNFSNTRRDLAIHVLKEPTGQDTAGPFDGTTYRFAYPDQNAFPPKRRIYDCEALFWAEGVLFLLTKSLGDTATRLYCFESLNANHVNKPALLGSFDIGPPVTAADASSDGRKLAILTTRSVWVFERPPGSRNYLDGPARTLRIQAGQCEAICWDDDNTLIIANESRELFQINLDQLLEH